MSASAAAPAPAAPAAPPALQAHGLTTGYDGTIVLRDVSITVPNGAVAALLGPNGAGKSTLLRAISGFLPAHEGRIAVGGRDLTRARPHERAAAGLVHVPEGRGIFRSLTVRENLTIQSPAGDEDAAIERAVSAFPILGERLRQRAGTLSGGQQQMLALAAAYVRRPSLILVDEPSLGLAPIVVDEIFAFLEQRAADGASILLVDQFAARALAMASVAYVLRKGRIVFEGTATGLGDADVFAHYLGSPPEAT